MKRFLAICTAVIITMTMLTACSGGENVNKEFNDEKMITISGKMVEIDNEKAYSFLDPEFGFGFIGLDEWEPLAENALGLNIINEAEINLSYITEKDMNKIKAMEKQNLTEEEMLKIYEEITNNQFDFLEIVRVNEDDKESSQRWEDVKSRYTKNIEVSKYKKDSYYIAYNDTLPKTELSEKDKTDINILIGSVEALKNNIMIYPADKVELEASLNKFTSIDMSGKEVTQDIFKEYDITMVNIWTTWCGFCVEEMPALQELYSQLPENVNMISICADASEEAETANKILQDSKAEFTTIQGNDELNKTLLDNIQGYPTTIFVDKDGNIVGEPQVGAPESDEAKIVEAYMTLINKNLSEIEK
ncbi:MAG: TlpA family protein disulfide reductase [Proteocatella sp.]